MILYLYNPADLTIVFNSLSKKHASNPRKESYIVCSGNIGAGAKRCRKNYLHFVTDELFSSWCLFQAMKAMFDTAKQQDAKLEQDDVEGVDSDEWVCV